MKQVFLSYSTIDILQTIELRDFLEKNGIDCWMGKRDIPPGGDYTVEITSAIDQCEVFVLVLTENAQNSQYVISEIECARSKKKRIIPYMLKDFPISESLEFHLRNRQRIHAYENKAKAEQTLLCAIQTKGGKPNAGNPENPHCVESELRQNTQIQDIRYGKHRMPVIPLENGKYQIVCKLCEHEYIDDTDFQKRLFEWTEKRELIDKLSWIFLFVQCIFGLFGALYGLISQSMSWVIHVLWGLISAVPIIAISVLSEEEKPTEHGAEPYPVQYDESFCTKTFCCAKCHREFTAKIPILERDKFIFKKNKSDSERKIM